MEKLLEGQRTVVGDYNGVYPLLMKKWALSEEVLWIPKHRAADAEVCFWWV